MPQITLREEPSSEKGSKDGADVESSIAPAFSIAPDAITHWLCVEGIEAIFLMGI